MAVGPGEPEYWLPEVRVLRGANKDVPSLPGALKKRLQKEGFTTAALTAFRTGEVLAVGTVLAEDNQLATVLWKDKPGNPEYFLTTINVPPKTALEPEILGGESLSSVRLLVGGDRVLKLDGKSWVEESKLPDTGLPDVWFGQTLVRSTDKGAFARMAAGSAWMPLALALPEGITKVPGGQWFSVDAEGVIWGNFDDLLVSSKPPAGGMTTITEADLVKRRKASVLRGGSDDATGQEPGMGGMPKCSTRYVLLDKMPVSADADKADYPAIRKALQGHTEFSKVKLVVSRERGTQLLGAQTADEELAGKLARHVAKAVKKSPASLLCAEPAVTREIKLDFATGEIAK
jgi:hypothetical protein